MAVVEYRLKRAPEIESPEHLDILYFLALKIGSFLEMDGPLWDACWRWAVAYCSKIKDTLFSVSFAAEENMVKVSTFFAMTFGAFLFWETMDKVHVWIALHQDEKQERMKKEAEIRKMREELVKQNKESESLL